MTFRQSGQKCAICGVALSMQDALLGVCRDFRCRGPFLKKQETQALADRKRWRESISQSLSVEKRRELLGPEVAVVANAAELAIVVPFFERPLVPQPTPRKQQFENKLRETLENAAIQAKNAAKRESLKSQFNHRWQETPSAPLAVINGCSTCRGLCCINGRLHAFLTEDFLAWRLLNEPESSVESLFQEYISFVPEVAYENSCVYHTENGCALPRKIRGPTCNDFICEGLNDVQVQFIARPNASSWVLSEENGAIRRMGILSQDKPRYEISLEQQRNNPPGSATSTKTISEDDTN